MQLIVHYYEDAGKAAVPHGAKLQLLDDSCQFTEGPVLHPDGYYLFSDIPANSIYSLVPGSEKQVYQSPSGFSGTEAERKHLSEQIGANGLCVHPEGAVVVCQHGAGGVSLLKNRQWVQKIATFENKRFNSPNDVVAASDGSIYFTDPPYGLINQKLNPGFAQPVAGVYAFANGKLHCFSTRYAYPNGICLSASEEFIYVCSNKPFEKFISVFDRRRLTEVGVLAEENSDGLKMDAQGNFWLCTKEGVVVLNSEGKRLLKIELPTVPANLCFGKEGREVFITARQNIFLLRLAGG